MDGGAAMREAVVADDGEVADLPVQRDAELVVDGHELLKFVVSHLAVVAEGEVERALFVRQVLHQRPAVEPHAVIGHAAVQQIASPSAGSTRTPKHRSASSADDSLPIRSPGRALGPSLRPPLGLRCPWTSASGCTRRSPPGRRRHRGRTDCAGNRRPALSASDRSRLPRVHRWRQHCRPHRWRRARAVPCWPGSSPSWWTCPHTPSRGDSADAQPAALPPRTRWLRGWVGAGLATRVLRQTAAFVGQAAKQWGDLPVRATQGLGVVLDLVGDFLEAHGVGPEHWTTGVHRPAVAVDPHHIDIAAANGDAFFEDLGALVDHWIQRALKDFLVAYFALGAALAFGKLADELLDLGVGGLGTRLGVVGVVTPAVLLAASAALAHDVADGVTGCCLLAPANVEASKVAHRERAHRQAEVVDDIVHLGRCCAFHQHAVALGAAHEQHAVANEPVAHANQRGGLADALAGGHRRRNDLLGRGVAAHDLHQFHHVGGGEEVHADDTLGARGCRGDLVDVQRRGVAGQHGAGLTDGVQLGEDGLLQIHVLEHGLDNHVAVGEVVLVG
ncbi:hypothetical protein GQR58_030034 [Nymphon striatum]|nr:hypothetical protein GQR58_030034 [Nymphon striatum]